MSYQSTPHPIGALLALNGLVCVQVVLVPLTGIYAWVSWAGVRNVLSRDLAEVVAALSVYSVVTGLKKLLPLLVVLLAGCSMNSGVAPRVEVGERPYQKLTWNDFQLTDSLDNGMSAQTATFIRWSFQWTVSRSGGGYVARPTSVTIESGMDKENSWRVRSVPAGSLDLLLAHEQLHYDMNEIQGRKLRAMPLEEWGTGFGPTSDAASADLKSKVDAIAKVALDEYERLSIQYDSETAHGTNVDAQQRWADKIGVQIGTG